MQKTGAGAIFYAEEGWPASDLGVGKMRTAIAGAAMLRKAIHITFVTNRIQRWRISILLLLKGGESTSRPCESS
jgi:hypothetical protein